MKYGLPDNIGYIMQNIGTACFCIDKAISFSKLSEPSLFLLIHGQNIHPVGSVKSQDNVTVFSLRLVATLKEDMVVTVKLLSKLFLLDPGAFCFPPKLLVWR